MFLPSCPHRRAFQRKGLMNHLGIFRLWAGFNVLCWLFKDGYFISFWHLLQKGDKSRGYLVKFCKTAPWVRNRSGRGERFGKSFLGSPSHRGRLIWWGGWWNWWWLCKKQRMHKTNNRYNESCWNCSIPGYVSAVSPEPNWERKLCHRDA